MICLLGIAWTYSKMLAHTAATDYTLCVYGNNGLLLTATAPHGALWAAKGGVPPKKYQYKDKAGANTGITKEQVATGGAGKSKAQVKGKGSSLPVVTLPLPPSELPVVVQLHNSTTAQCWTSDFTNMPVKNTASKFLVKLP